MMHPVDTLKTRLQSQIIMNATQVLLSRYHTSSALDLTKDRLDLIVCLPSILGVYIISKTLTLFSC